MLSDYYCFFEEDEVDRGENCVIRAYIYAELVAVSNAKAYKTCHAVLYNDDQAKFNNLCLDSTCVQITVQNRYTG